MKDIIVIAGKAASGKDTLKQNLLEIFKQENIEINNIITCTTRPKREYEVNGKDYNFYTSEVMTEKILLGELAEAIVFNSWVYGTEYKALSSNHPNLGVFNPSGIEAFKQDSSLNVFTIYLDVDAQTRLIRYLQRERNMGSEKIEEMFRRYRADEEDFDGVEELADEIVTVDPNNTSMETAWVVYDIIKKKFDI